MTTPAKHIIKDNNNNNNQPMSTECDPVFKQPLNNLFSAGKVHQVNKLYNSC